MPFFSLDIIWQKIDLFCYQFLRGPVIYTYDIDPSFTFQPIETNGMVSLIFNLGLRGQHKYLLIDSDFVLVKVQAHHPALNFHCVALLSKRRGGRNQNEEDEQGDLVSQEFISHGFLPPQKTILQFRGTRLPLLASLGLKMPPPTPT